LFQVANVFFSSLLCPDLALVSPRRRVLVDGRPPEAALLVSQCPYFPFAIDRKFGARAFPHPKNPFPQTFPIDGLEKTKHPRTPTFSNHFRKVKRPPQVITNPPPVIKKRMMLTPIEDVKSPRSREA